MTKRLLGTRLASLFIAICGIFLQADASYASVKNFHPDSLTEIISDRKNQPFLMVLWSIDCPPCLKELSLFKAFKDKLTKENFVLISTDAPEAAAEIQQTLKDNQLEDLESWIFSDVMAGRLRYVIDPHWFGELPRAYFYNSQHERMAHSGVLRKERLTQWFEMIQHDSL